MVLSQDPLASWFSPFSSKREKILSVWPLSVLVALLEDVSGSHILIVLSSAPLAIWSSLSRRARALIPFL